MSESATLESPQAATDTDGQPQVPTGTNGQAQEAAAQPGDEAKPQAAAESTGETPSPAEPVDMNWLEQKTAEQEAGESENATEEPIGSRGARHIGDPPDMEMWKLIKSAREEEKAAEEEVNLLSVEMKEAKKRHEGASSRLGKLLDESDHPNLFTGQKVKPEPIENAKAPEAEANSDGPKPDNAAQDESWRAITLADLGIKPTTLKILAEHLPSLTTHGELADWQQKKGDFWAKDISGVGPTKRKEIEDAQFAYWQKHPQPAKAEPSTGERVEPSAAAESAGTEGEAGVRGEASATLTLDDLGLTKEQVEAAYYPALLKESIGDKPADCPNVLTLKGNTWTHVAVPGPVGGADLQLVPLISMNDRETVKVDESDRYGGIIVTHKLEKFYLGGVSQSLFISSPKAHGAADAKLTRAEAKAAKMESVLA